MPRTERGPAPCNRREWNPADGQSPITNHDRRDARFINTTNKPPRRGKQIVGADTGIARSNLKPNESVFGSGEPAFDRGLFESDYRAYTNRRLPDGLSIPERHAKRRWNKGKAYTLDPGAAVPAVYEGASCGGGVKDNPKEQFTNASYERLTIKAQTKLNLAEKYPYRWDEAARAYADGIRTGGKATHGFDLSWTQAAGRLADEALDYLSTRQLPYRHLEHKCPIAFYEKPFLGIAVLWLMAGLDAPLKDFLYFAAEASIPEKGPPRQKKKLNIPLRKPRPITERDKTIAKFWFLAKKKCRGRVPRRELADAIMACMERITKTYDDSYKPELGAFASFAEQAIDWAIADFMKELRRQVPVQRSINANVTEEEDDSNSETPETVEVIKLDNLEDGIFTAKLRRVAERMGCLNDRERHVMEARLGLNGYTYPRTHRMVADEIGTSERHVQRIEDGAVEKLQRAVA
jgi:RNA polymerase sigma factor (sigma-70 family)